MAPSVRLSARSRLLALGLSLLFLPLGLQAQEEVIPIIRGEVRAGSDPLPGAMVVLHQVSSELSGEIDSIRANADGTFQLTLPRVPAHGVRSEVYFASARYRGLFYFGAAITDPMQLDSLYLIQAFDTLSVPAGGAVLPVSARSLFLEKVEEGWEATDFFQLSQDGDRTLYSPDEGLTWRYPLPQGAREFQIGQSELAPDAIRFEGGDLALYAPIPPGDRVFLIRYHLPDDEFTIPMPGRTDRMEILVREPGPEVEVPPLIRTSPMELEQGNVFKRYEGLNFQDAQVSGRILAEPSPFRAEWIGLFLAALLGGVGVFAFRLRRPQKNVVEPAAEVRERASLVTAIAQLDEAFQSSGDRAPEARTRYQARRERLLGQLKQRS